MYRDTGLLPGRETTKHHDYLPRLSARQQVHKPTSAYLDVMVTHN